MKKTQQPFQRFLMLSFWHAVFARKNNRVEHEILVDCGNGLFFLSESGQPRLVEFSGFKDLQDSPLQEDYSYHLGNFTYRGRPKIGQILILTTYFLSEPCLPRQVEFMWFKWFFWLYDYGWNANAFCEGLHRLAVICRPFRALIFCRAHGFNRGWQDEENPSTVSTVYDIVILACSLRKEEQ